MRHALRFCLAALFATSAALAGAGTVEVVALSPDSYSDAGNSRSEEPDNIQRLSAFLVDLGARMLPANQSVRIELLDVDLAGSVRPTSSPVPIRTIRNTGDYPRIHVRYTSQVNGQTVRTADEWITDMDYARGLQSPSRSREAMYYDKRMLENWFNRTFVQTH